MRLVYLRFTTDTRKFKVRAERTKGLKHNSEITLQSQTLVAETCFQTLTRFPIRYSLLLSADAFNLMSLKCVNIKIH